MFPLMAAAGMAPGLANQMLKGASAQKGAGLFNQFGPAIGTAIGAMGPAARAHRKALREDTAAMEAGKLGYSEAQKNQMMAGTNAQIQAAQQGVSDNARSMAAVAGYGNSGAANQMMAERARANALGAATAMSNIEGDSQQQALARKSDILGRLDKQKEIAKDDWAKAFSKPVKPPTNPYGKIIPDPQGLSTTFGVGG